MKPKNMIWKSSDGRESSLSDMETEHLHNLVMYLFRRLEEAARLAEYAKLMDKILPEPSTQGHLIQEWVQAGVKELHKREAIEYEKSMSRILASPHYKGGVN